MDIIKMLDEEMLRSLTIRAACNDDLNFILNSWLKSNRKTHKTESKVYYEYYSQVVIELLRRSQTLVVVQEEYPDIIVGYLCFEYTRSIPTLHYLYVKELWRNRGVAQMLLNSVLSSPNQLCICTHQTPASKKYLSDRYKSSIYNPYILEGVSL